MKCLTNGFAAAIVVAVLAGFAGPSVGADPSSWSYTGASGPTKWGKLSKEFAVCGTGTMQSPIDIADKDVRKGDLPALTMLTLLGTIAAAFGRLPRGVRSLLRGPRTHRGSEPRVPVHYT